tara:strand:- start:32 stop:418 length:387 start_codon:yes stop_codon:yes gene_type:complete
MRPKQTKEDRAARAIDAATATIDSAPTKESGSIIDQYDHIGAALHAAATIHPLTLEILSSIADMAAQRESSICGPYRTLLANAANGFESKAEAREREAANDAARKAATGDATPEEIRQALAAHRKANG